MFSSSQTHSASCSNILCGLDLFSLLSLSTISSKEAPEVFSCVIKCASFIPPRIFFFYCPAIVSHQTWLTICILYLGNGKNDHQLLGTTEFICNENIFVSILSFRPWSAFIVFLQQIECCCLRWLWEKPDLPSGECLQKNRTYRKDDCSHRASLSDVTALRAAIFIYAG